MASTDDQETEIQKLKEIFPDQVRIIRNLGEFNYVVNVHPEGLDVNIKFQLTEQYPKTLPNIFVKLGNKADGAEQLTSILTKKAQEYTGFPMLENLIQFAINQIDIMGLDVQTSDIVLNTGKQKQKGKKKHGKKKKYDEKEEEDKKKVSMKTAGDVISRIMWDETLPSDQFTVGYMDRFIGMVEKNFSAFSWEDLASVDYTVLAIPKHRIHYFKYKDLKVWDKDKRMDNVFGSTGSQRTIIEVMEEYEANRRAAEAEYCQVKREGVANSACADEDDSDDDSDDGIQITIGTLSEPSLVLMQDNGDMAQMLQGAAKTDMTEFWEDKLRPNYFLAVRIRDSEIIKNVEQVRNAILKSEPRYRECCIPNGSLHITLCVIRLDTPEQVTNAIQTLEKGRSELTRMAPKGKALRLEGVSNFYDRVIYAKVHYPPEFLEFVDHLKLCLWEGGVSNKDGYEFVPHMTIMKVTRPVARSIGTAKVNRSLSSAHADMYFGTQSIDGIHLCAMGDERREDGFYMTPVSINFGVEVSPSVATISDSVQATLSDTDEEMDAELSGVSRKLKQSSLSDKVRSNYFLTVKIDDPEIVRNVEAFQQTFKSKEPIFQDFCIPSHDLHVTFGTLFLENQDQVSKANEILTGAKSELSNIFSKEQSINIEGLGVFFDRVIYAKLIFPPQFLDYLSATVRCLVQAGFAVREKEDYIPHLTLVRVSYQDVRVRKLKKMEAQMIDNWAETKFGSQSNIGVHLCPVGKLSRVGSVFPEV